MSARIAVDREKVSDFCRRNHILKLSLFGSVLRDDFRPDSDVDVLLEFEEGHVVGFFGLARLERELSELFGRKIDLRTPEELSTYFRRQVVESAESLYVRG